MSFFKKLFGGGAGGKKEPAPEPMRGIEKSQSDDQQRITRENMEAQMAAQKDKREHPASGEAPTTK